MNKNTILKKSNKKGFSLIELMIVVAILALIVLGLVTFFTGGARSWITGQNQLKAQREARQAIDRMVREIREGQDIKSVSTDDSVTVDVPHFDTNGNIDYYYEVEFELENTTIKRNTNPLIENVLKITGEPIFTYYNNSGTPITSPDGTVSKVHLNLKVDVDRDNKPDITLNTDVNLRNHGL